MLKVAAFTGGRRVPSARYRVRQHVAPLRELGVDLREFPGRAGAYPPARKSLRPWWAAASLGDRLPAVIRSYGADLSLLQREMLSTFLTLEPLVKRPRILDVDDAIWLHGGFAQKLAVQCEAIICGNDYLAENFALWNKEVTVIPTAVDTELIRPASVPAAAPTIGWTGTSSGFKFLYQIEPALKNVLQNHPASRLLIVSDRRPDFRQIDPGRLDFVKWTPAGEAESMKRMTIGIMPLEDTEWARGKCSFKMLLYMSAALPVVVSPVGMNNEILSLGNIGYGCHSVSEWSDSLSDLLDNQVKCRRMGEIGRRIVEENFSLAAVAPRLAEFFKKWVD